MAAKPTRKARIHANPSSRETVRLDDLGDGLVTMANQVPVGQVHRCPEINKQRISSRKVLSRKVLSRRARSRRVLELPRASSVASRAPVTETRALLFPTATAKPRSTTADLADRGRPPACRRSLVQGPRQPGETGVSFSQGGDRLAHSSAWSQSRNG